MYCSLRTAHHVLLTMYCSQRTAHYVLQARLTKMDVPFLRPDDYFAEMLKTDQHMAKVCP